ncbi:MAG: HTH domain-containing protein [Lachnospiraceae bacterium]|nr:HTH domain-containing protein [Lachnospiraceae bacterium]
MTAWERRHAILLALYRRKRETRENLASEFGVSKRTIETDIEALSLAHFPVYTKSGYEGGIFIDEDYVPDMKFCSRKQAEFLVALLPKTEGEDRGILLSIIETFCSKKYREELL